MWSNRITRASGTRITPPAESQTLTPISSAFLPCLSSLSRQREERKQLLHFYNSLSPIPGLWLALLIPLCVLLIPLTI